MILEIAYIVLLVVYIYTIFTTILFLLVENRNPVKSIAWILVLLFVPVLGVFFYFLVGKKFRKKHIISKRSLRLLKKYESSVNQVSSDGNMTEKQKLVANLALKNSDASLFENNAVEVFSDATVLYEKIFEDIKNAKHHINLEYYIFCPDKLGRRMMEALKEKAKEGLKIRVIIDDVGSWRFKKRHVQELTDVGIEVKSFLSVGLPFINSHVNYRNHRKILVIDGRVAYTGGINIADRYIEGLKWGIWRDTHVRLMGSVVLGLQKVFFEDWYFVKQSLVDDSMFYPKPEQCGNVLLQPVISGPDMQWESIMQLYVKSFALATKCIYIETPYFLPPESLINVLQCAALSGVDVRIILPRKSDAVITLYSSYSYLDQMMKSGIKIYFYQPGFIHSKVTIVDDDLSFVGSANMDFRSFEQNFELNTIIYDKGVTAELISLFKNDMENSVEVYEEDWKSRSNREKIKESLARLFSPLL